MLLKNIIPFDKYFLFEDIDSDIANVNNLKNQMDGLLKTYNDTAEKYQQNSLDSNQLIAAYTNFLNKERDYKSLKFEVSINKSSDAIKDFTDTSIADAEQAYAKTSESYVFNINENIEESNIEKFQTEYDNAKEKFNEIANQFKENKADKNVLSFTYNQTLIKNIDLKLAKLKYRLNNASADVEGAIDGVSDKDENNE